MMENNIKILNYLANNFPNCVSELSLEGSFLVYRGERINISDFDLQLFFMSIPNFDTQNSFYDLDSEDLFKIIKLHVLYKDTLKMEGKKDNQTEIDQLQNSIELFKHVNVVKTKEGIEQLEYIVVDDKNGVSHTFKNDSKLDIFDIYFSLQAKDPQAEVTSEMLIDELNHKLYEIDMESASNLLDRTTTSEDFENKIRRVSEPYEADSSVHVLGNQEEDIALITDSMNPSKKDVKTFDENEYGDLIIETHGSNPNVGQDNKAQLTEENSQDIEFNDDTEKEIIPLIPLEEFYKMFDGSYDIEFSDQERKDVDLYYAFFGDLILYEDYLLPELKRVLEEFRNFTDKLAVEETDEKPLTIRQSEVIDKRADLEEKKKDIDNSLDQKRSEEYVKTLKLRMDSSNSTDNTGSISILAVIGIIVGVAVILTAVTMYLIG